MNTAGWAMVDSQPAVCGACAARARRDSGARGARAARPEQTFRRGGCGLQQSIRQLRAFYFFRWSDGSVQAGTPASLPWPRAMYTLGVVEDRASKASSTLENELRMSHNKELVERGLPTAGEFVTLRPATHMQPCSSQKRLLSSSPCMYGLG